MTIRLCCVWSVASSASRERLSTPLSSADFEYEISDGGPSERALHGGVRAGCEFPARTYYSSVAWRTSAAPRPSTLDRMHSSSPIPLGPRLTCFMQSGWKFPISHLRPAHLLSGGQQYPATRINPDEVRKTQSKRLSDACSSVSGIEGWETH